MVIIVMGVCGSGKSTVGPLIARALDLPFFDADAFHPENSVAKMRAGIPLDDADRAPWLQTLAGKIAAWDATGGAVLGCSALKESYRSQLSSGGAEVRFVYLKGSPDLIRARMEARHDHYMKAGMIESQFSDLEEPEGAIVVDIAGTPAHAAEQALQGLRSPQEAGL